MRPSRLFMTFRLYQSAFPTLNTISSLEKAPAYNARGGETRVGYQLNKLARGAIKAKWRQQHNRRTLVLKVRVRGLIPNPRSPTDIELTKRGNTWGPPGSIGETKVAGERWLVWKKQDREECAGHRDGSEVNHALVRSGSDIPPLHIPGGQRTSQLSPVAAQCGIGTLEEDISSGLAASSIEDNAAQGHIDPGSAEYPCVLSVHDTFSAPRLTREEVYNES
ncbi:hypothetical protein NDU88_005535 [Pleurodeles waltl]|uniref:Uncharacterized protein n=1 Tax=Pleurodeles waltl TaxID=8319 RepID=A0AAV7QKX6_PLEWA|nr:hypothetical protein NDU88_005535 [Pleurodeles waltl]